MHFNEFSLMGLFFVIGGILNIVMLKDPTVRKFLTIMHKPLFKDEAEAAAIKSTKTSSLLLIILGSLAFLFATFDIIKLFPLKIRIYLARNSDFIFQMIIGVMVGYGMLWGLVALYRIRHGQKLIVPLKEFFMFWKE